RVPEVPMRESGALFAAASAVVDGPVRYGLPVLAPEERRSALEVLAEEVRGSFRCGELAYGRKNTVFGEGTVTPRVVFFGEGPGADEDRTGRPFVGCAGQLLTRMSEACTFAREDCYIMNTVKCRPPAIRNPQLDEVEHCRGYFERQLEI